jgi:non-specific serine/threonine protein kinase
MIGRQISHYKIVEKLGEGGMSVVYKAEDTKLKRSVALKFLRSDLFGNEEQKERFVREAQTAAILDHPNICTVYEIDEADGQLFISMASIEGATLKDKIRPGGLDIYEVFDIAIQIGRGLEAAHSKGIVHRDIKCSNIMVTGEGFVKITDFGLAKPVGGTEISKTTVGAGTPSYMSPEQAGGNAVDHRTDIWSLGVSLYEMLTGELPFKGDYDAAVAYSILNEKPRPVSDLRPGTPIEVENIVAKSMTKKPDDRYQEMSEMLAHLEAPALAAALDVGVDFSPGVDAVPSIAVIPFVDMSPQKDQEYFCDGIAEEITNKLVRVGALKVASRTSAFTYKNSVDDVRDIGKKLGVTSILEGSVRKAGSRIRVTGQLINTRDGYHLWSDKYDRELDDVFAIQDEIAENIVDALSVTLSEKEHRDIRKPAAKDVEAYDFYLRGRRFFYQGNRKTIGYALQMFRSAIEKDPQYAHAYAGTADCHSYMYMNFDRDRVHLDQAVELSEKALLLDPDLAEAHASYGHALSLDEQFERAEGEFEKAIELNPQLFEAYFFYARTCFAQGQVGKSAELFEKASLVDPDDFQAPILLAQSYRSLGEIDKQMVALRRGLRAIDRHLDMNPDHVRAMYMKATVHIETGDNEEGLKWVERAMAAEPDDPMTLYGVACLYGRMGNIEAGIDFLEKSITAGFAYRGWIENDPDMDAFRNHPRFVKLLEKLA